MVSRRNFAAITIMLIILLFMFQFTGVMKDKLSKYGINEYKESATTELTKQDMYLASGQKKAQRACILQAEITWNSADLEEQRHLQGQMRARNVLRAVERELLLCREKNLQGEMILKAAWTICRSSSRNEEQYAASDHL